MQVSHRRIRPRRYAKPRAIGAYSSAGAMAKVDGRSKEALFMARRRRELTQFVGEPNAIQKQLIERCVRLTMQVELLDERLFKDGHLSDRDQRQYLAWSNSLSRTLSRLGVDRKKDKTRKTDEPVIASNAEQEPELPLVTRPPNRSSAEPDAFQTKVMIR